MKRKQSPEPINTFVDNRYETGLVRKGENWRTEMILVHVGAPVAPEFAIAIYNLNRNPNMNPSWQVGLTMAEARLLRDVLNRPETAKWLDQE